MCIRNILLKSAAIITGIAAIMCFSAGTPAEKSGRGNTAITSPVSHRTVYETIGIAGKVDYTAFEQAMTGYELIDGRKKEILVLIDFSKPSTEERMFVIDLRYKKLLYKSLVSHGRGSGENYATSFSNIPGSNKSSLGFYLTKNTYEGRNGYSLRLDGLEAGINDKAFERAIVIHGADYSTQSFIRTAGRLGRSFGCPSLPSELSDQIINTIKDGAVLFIYAGDNNYRIESPILSGGALALKQAGKQIITV